MKWILGIIGVLGLYSAIKIYDHEHAKTVRTKRESSHEDIFDGLEDAVEEFYKR